MANFAPEPFRARWCLSEYWRRPRSGLKSLCPGYEGCPSRRKIQPRDVFADGVIPFSLKPSHKSLLGPVHMGKNHLG